tara:strand:- start:65 stop:328 length:264 start_codon:yes stop_codon:yes gene_type:complete
VIQVTVDQWVYKDHKVFVAQKGTKAHRVTKVQTDHRVNKVTEGRKVNVVTRGLEDLLVNVVRKGLMVIKGMMGLMAEALVVKRTLKD